MWNLYLYLFSYILEILIKLLELTTSTSAVKVHGMEILEDNAVQEEILEMETKIKHIEGK